MTTTRERALERVQKLLKMTDLEDWPLVEELLEQLTADVDALQSRITELELACAQAVEFATYVEQHAKGKMEEAAKNFLSLPFAQELAVVLKAGREAQVTLTNPHTGEPRDYRDVESDPAGVLIHKAGEPIIAAKQPEAQAVAWIDAAGLAALAKQRAGNEPGYVLVEVCDSENADYDTPLYTRPTGEQAAREGGEVVALMDKFRALVAAHDGEFAFVDGVKLCLRELEAAIAGCQTEGRELPKYFVEYSECEKAAYMRGIAVGENIASRDPVFAALDSVVPGWREHGSDTASAAATVITELSARATSNGSRPFRWDDDEGETPSA